MRGEGCENEEGRLYQRTNCPWCALFERGLLSWGRANLLVGCVEGEGVPLQRFIACLFWTDRACSRKTTGFAGRERGGGGGEVRGKQRETFYKGKERGIKTHPKKISFKKIQHLLHSFFLCQYSFPPFCETGDCQPQKKSGSAKTFQTNPNNPCKKVPAQNLATAQEACEGY